MRKFTLLLLLSAIHLGLAAQTARLQVIHNSPSPTVDIWVNGVPFLPSFAFRTATPFVDVPAGLALEIGIAPSPSSSPADIIATFPVNLLPGETYTVLANGVVGDPDTPFELAIHTGTRESSLDTANTDLLVFHGAPDAPAVDVAVRGLGDVVTDLGFGAFTGYLSVPAADVILDVKPAGEETVVASFSAPLSLLEGQSATVFASGFLSGDPGFGLWAALADGTVIGLEALTNARVQIIHISPSPTVDIWVNDQPFLTDFAFRTATPFVDVPGNTALNIGIAPSPSNSPADIIATFPVNLLPGETYVVMANGVVGDPDAPFDLVIFGSGRESSGNAGEVDLLVFHGSPDAPAVDVTTSTGVTLIQDLAFGEFQGYATVPPFNYELQIRPAGEPTILATYLADLSALGGGSAVVFASGYLADTPGFGLWVALADGTTFPLSLLTSTDNRILGEMTVFPNPVTDRMDIRLFSETESRIALTVYDATGRQVLSRSHQVFDGENRLEMPVGELGEGWYILELRGDSGAAVRKTFAKF